MTLVCLFADLLFFSDQKTHRERERKSDNNNNEKEITKFNFLSLQFFGYQNHQKHDYFIYSRRMIYSFHDLNE